MDLQWLQRLAVATALAAVMARRGLRKRSLSRSGAAAAFAVGLSTMQASYTFGLLLILFYTTSSKLTKLQQERKQQLEDGFKADGQRGAVQVLSNSLGGVAAALTAQLAPALLGGGPEGAALRWAASAAFLAHYAAVCADTWASEVGILAPHPPRLVTTWRRVPPGTNGAVTPLGCACSGAAGLLMGGAYWGLGAALGDVPLAPPRGWGGGGDQWAGGGGGGGRGGGGGGWRGAAAWAAAGVAAGAAGSLVDSLLGATVQFSGLRDAPPRRVASAPGPGVTRICGRPWLSNDAVNAAAAAAASLAAGAAAWRAAGAGGAGPG
ncbi:MAG: integral membrane protein DUF92-domain-containing protein [Monoraphidium minutum]|nr:MAG: integral membrane protein DUF92-domain-containing protein [Monoraphidium minutum]